MPTNTPPKPSRPAPTTHKAHASATTYTLVTEPDQGLTAIYNLIASAKKSIDMTMYELTDVTVMDAFAKAAKAGVTVRVILDQSGDEKKVNTPAYNYLEENKCGVHWANPAYAVTHQKTITVDAATSAIMTLNLTPTDYKTTRDFAVITNNAADVAAIETTFNADFTNAKITPPTGENLVWSPTNASSALLGLVNGATKSLLISQEEFGDETLVAAVVAALKRGATVTLVQENMNNQYNATLTTTENRRGKDRHVLVEYGPLHPCQNGAGRLRHGQCEVVCGLGEFHHPVAGRQPGAGADFFRRELHGGRERGHYRRFQRRDGILKRLRLALAHDGHVH